MREVLSSIDFKQFKKMLRNKDFVFCIISYPIGLLIYITLRIYIANVNFEDTGLWYTATSFVVLAFVAVISIFERIEKRALHKVQGDKLKIKQKEGSWKN